MSDIRPLAEGFPVPGEADWLRLVEKAAGGRTVADLAARTAEGLEIAALYRDAEPLRAARSQAGPDGAAWDIRVFADHADPAEANRRLLEDLEGGANSAIVAVRHRPEGDGVGLASAEDLLRALDRVDLHLATIALDAGFLGALAAEWMDAAGKAGPRTRMALHLDPLGAFAREGQSPGPLSGHLARTAEVAARLHGRYPLARSFLASGGAVHDAGGSDAQELAFMAASALAYGRALTDAGMSAEAAFATLTVGVSLDADYFSGVAKLRAARLIAGRIASACGAESGVVIEARSSRRMLSTLDPWTNLLRLTAAGFAGAVGGAEAVALDPFTRPLGGPSELARRLARNTQLILMEESHLGAVADPAAGAWFLDTYTRDLAGAAWALFQEIERRGGAARALASGWLAERIGEVRDARQAAFAAKTTPMIGVTLHPNPVVDPIEVDPPSRADGPLPDAGLAGADDRCPALAPVRWSAPFETTATEAARP